MVTESKTAAQVADEAAELDEFLKPAEYVGETFRIDGFEIVQTEHGPRHVAQVGVNGGGEQSKMWAGGVILQRQLDAWADRGDFPVTVRLEKFKDRMYRYYVVEAVAENGTPNAFSQMLEEEGIKE